MSEKETLRNVLDGEKISITRIINGEPATELILVRRVSIRNLDNLGLAWGNTIPEIKVYTGVDDEFIDTLSPESALDIVEKGRELNGGPFGRWLKQKTDALSVVNLDKNPVFQKAIADALAQSPRPQV